jgi:hypothetical protein
LGVGQAVGGPHKVAEGIEQGGHPRLAESEGGRGLSGSGAGGLDEIGELRGRCVVRDRSVSSTAVDAIPRVRR